MIIAMAARLQLSASSKGPKFPSSCLGTLPMYTEQRLDQRWKTTISAAMGKHKKACLQSLSPRKDKHCGQICSLTRRSS